MKHIYRATLIVSALVASAYSQTVVPDDIDPTQMSLSNAAKIVEGVLYGIVKEQFPEGELDNCIQKGEEFEEKVMSAVHDLESLTFDGIKQGLSEAGEAVHMIPDMVSKCESAEKDLGALLKMAEAFEHPFSLIWHAGKNLIVNGADIFDKINVAVTNYKAEKYFDFGFALGEALDEVFLKSTVGAHNKRPVDEHAYNFLIGFLGSQPDIVINKQNLYNGIDGKGAMLYGPVESVMRGIAQNNGELNKHAWMGIHEIEHIFNEGGDILVNLEVITSDEVSRVRNFAACLDEQNLNDLNSTPVKAYFDEAAMAFAQDNSLAVGEAFANAAKALCNEPALFLQ